MKIIETSKMVVDGKLIIDMPSHLNNQEVRVVISSDADEEDWANLSPYQKEELLKSFVGKDKFPYIKVGKYDVYEQ